MATPKYIAKVAIVGAGGNVGTFITHALLETKKHTITAIRRVGSPRKFPAGVFVQEVDYTKPETIVEALIGQDALVITLSGHAAKDTEMKLIKAAGEAGVSWIIPSEFAPDTANESLVKDVFVFQPKVHHRKVILDLGKSSYIAICTGLWYEYTLAMPASFGIDFAKRSAILYDEGETKISVSTWPQIGRCIAALLSLPINYDEPTSIRQFFTLSQREMLDSALRVTGTNEAQWTITKEPTQERHVNGLKEIEEGKRIGYAKMMYTRVFFQDGCGDFESGKGTINTMLGLPKEDLDTFTRIAIERSTKSNYPSRENH